MLQVDDIKNYCTNYKIENGNVIDKKTNTIVLDENIILNVKASILIFNDAKEAFNNQIRGETKTFSDFVELYIKRFGINGDINDFPENKTIRNIINNNGYFLDEYYAGNTLTDSRRYNILVEPRKDYTMALINLIAHKEGKHIDNLNVEIDLSEYNKLGNSNVEVKYNISKYKKKNTESQSISTNQSLFSHPQAALLNQLENQKRQAQIENDEVAYNYAQENINKILRENPLNVSEAEYNVMNREDKIRYINLKLKEAKALNDHDLFNYWNANLKHLESIKIDNTTIQEYHAPLYNSPLSNNIETLERNTSVKTEEKDYKYYYQELMKQIERRRTSSQITESEKKEIIGSIVYNQGYMIKSLKNEDEYIELIKRVVTDLSSDEFETNIQNSILDEIHPKINKKRNASTNNNIENNQQIKQKDQSDKINVLKQQINDIMNSDKKIDIEELYVLIKKIDKLDDVALMLKINASNELEEQILNDIIELINTEKQKMINVQKRVENITSGFTR